MMTGHLSTLADLSGRGRVITIAAWVGAIIVVTHFNIAVEAPITEAISGYITVTFLLLLAIIDYKTHTLPNIILLAWLGCRVALIFAGIAIEGTFEILINSAFGAVAMGVIFLAMYYISKRSLGGGDVKLSFVMGLSLMLSMVFSAVFLALVLCALFSLGALALKKLTRKDPVPLGPFFFAGTVAAYILPLIGGQFLV